MKRSGNYKNKWIVTYSPSKSGNLQTWCKDLALHFTRKWDTFLGLRNKKNQFTVHPSLHYQQRHLERSKARENECNKVHK